MTQRRAIIWRAVSHESQAAEDKVSLEEQERAAREWCSRNDCAVVAVLTVPGHSRYESDVTDALDEFRQNGITAYDQLKRHWLARDFDVLVAYHPSRLGRSVALFAYAVENVVRSGAVIHCVIGGEINQSNFTMAYAMGSIQATQGISTLVAGKKAGMKKRASRGLHTGSTLPFFHIYERDDHHRPVRLVVDRQRYQRLIDDLYQVVVDERVNWDNIEKRLYELGHAAEDGRPWRTRFFRDILLAPACWGNLGTGYRARGRVQKRQWWMIEPTDDMPDNVHMEYGVCEPVYAGEQADRLKAELRRRLDMTGQARANNTYAFSGLCQCGECGRTMGRNKSSGGWMGYTCKTRWIVARNMRGGITYCSQRSSISVKVLREFVHGYLDEYLPQIAQTGTLPQQNPVGAPDYPALIEADLSRVDRQIQTLTVRLGSAPDTVLPDIYAQLQALGQQRENLRAQLAAIHYRSDKTARRINSVKKAAQAILDMGLPNFWEQPEVAIHQLLHPLLAGWRIIVLDGEIIGFKPIDS